MRWDQKKKSNRLFEADMRHIFDANINSTNGMRSEAWSVSPSNGSLNPFPAIDNFSGSPFFSLL